MAALFIPAIILPVATAYWFVAAYFETAPAGDR